MNSWAAAQAGAPVAACNVAGAGVRRCSCGRCMCGRLELLTCSRGSHLPPPLRACTLGKSPGAPCSPSGTLCTSSGTPGTSCGTPGTPWGTLGTPCGTPGTPCGAPGGSSGARAESRAARSAWRELWERQMRTSAVWGWQSHRAAHRSSHRALPLAWKTKRHGLARQTQGKARYAQGQHWDGTPEAWPGMCALPLWRNKKRHGLHGGPGADTGWHTEGTPRAYQRHTEGVPRAPRGHTRAFPWHALAPYLSPWKSRKPFSTEQVPARGAGGCAPRPGSARGRAGAGAGRHPSTRPRGRALGESHSQRSAVGRGEVGMGEEGEQRESLSA